MHMTEVIVPYVSGFTGSHLSETTNGEGVNGFIVQ